MNSRFAAIAFASFLLACSDPPEPDLQARKESLRNVSLDSLTTNEKVHLVVRADTVRNCDSTSQARVLVRADSNVTKDGERKYPFDLFLINRIPVREFSVLNYAGDSLYVGVRLTPPNQEAVFVSLCLERKDIAEVLVDFKPVARAEGEHRGKGKRGSRRSGGFGAPGY